MILVDTYACPILGPQVTLFWISGDVVSGFQNQIGLPCWYCEGDHNVRSLRSTSGISLCLAAISCCFFPEIQDKTQGCFFPEIQDKTQGCFFPEIQDKTQACIACIIHSDENIRHKINFSASLIRI